MFGTRKALRLMSDRLLMLEARVDELTRELAFLQSANGVTPEAASEGRDMHLATRLGERRFNAAGFPILARDETIFFADPDNAVFLGAGWWGTEPWGTWGRGTSELRFCVGEGYLGGYLEVHLGVRGPAGDAERPSLRIVANGYFLGDYPIAGQGRPLRLRLPPAALGDGNVLMVLDYSDPWRPPPQGDVSDPRTLGVGLVSLLLP
jgi:hypothetical protein